MKVRIAELNDFEVLDNILKEVTTRLKNKGSKQWAYILTNGEQDVLRTHILKEEVLVIEENNLVVGTCYLYTQPNEWDYGLWQREENKDSFYLHKLAISDLFVGKHYGKKVMNSILEYVAEIGGEQVLLDARADVTYLNQFYQRIGFEFVAQVKENSAEILEADFNLYEYRLQQ